QSFNQDTWRLGRQVWLGNLALEGARYLVVGLLFWGLVHVLLRRRLAHRVIAGWPRGSDLRRELLYSGLSLMVFAGIGLGVTALFFSGYAVIYRRPDRYGWAWFWLSLPVLLVLHDAYFYWTHRLLHTRWLFRRFHGLHHRSRQPSPWAAYAFHPVEALVNGLFTPLLLCLLPVHGGVMLVFSLHQIIRNAHGHLSIETLPAGFARHWLGGRFTTTTHHHMHHETARGNYGLWFTWWDRWCGTEQLDYLQRFDRATTTPPAPRKAGPAAGMDQRKPSDSQGTAATMAVPTSSASR
ncbi:MAG: sterol desaturase family protein, partial [Curvibacter sp.]|nr:sterol desaturase family protein [Curvibacter sp.]